MRLPYAAGILRRRPFQGITDLPQILILTFFSSVGEAKCQTGLEQGVRAAGSVFRPSTLCGPGTVEAREWVPPCGQGLDEQLQRLQQNPTPPPVGSAAQDGVWVPGLEEVGAAVRGGREGDDGLMDIDAWRFLLGRKITYFCVISSSVAGSPAKPGRSRSAETPRGSGSLGTLPDSPEVGTDLAQRSVSSAWPPGALCLGNPGLPTCSLAPLSSRERSLVLASSRC